MGKNSEIIASKLRVIKPKTLSIWLIYALALTLYAPDLIGELELWMLGYLYPFFVGVFGFYAIYVYNKKTKLRKESTSETEKPKIETPQKKTLKEEKKLSKIRKNLENKFEFVGKLIKKNKLDAALKNLREIKDEAEKHEFFDLILKTEENIEYCRKELSKA